MINLFFRNSKKVKTVILPKGFFDSCRSLEVKEKANQETAKVQESLKTNLDKICKS